MESPRRRIAAEAGKMEDLSPEFKPRTRNTSKVVPLQNVPAITIVLGIIGILSTVLGIVVFLAAVEDGHPESDIVSSLATFFAGLILSGFAYALRKLQQIKISLRNR